jgi:hypothetical protein
MFTVANKMELIKSVASLAFAIYVILMESEKGPSLDWNVMPGIH